MRKRTLVAIILVFAISHLALVSCKKKETAGVPPSPEAHRTAMLEKSFAESKKVAAARVNGEAITMFSLLQEMNAIAPQYLAPGKQRTPELDAKIRKHALDTVIFEELAVQEAKKRGMTVTSEVLDREIKKIKADTGSADAFREYLVQRGLSESELRKMIEQDALFEMISAQEVDAKITVTEADLRTRYNKEKAGLKDSSHKQMTYEAAKGMLEQRVRAEAGEKRMREWEQELRKNARIEVLDQKQKQG
jgi:parvulin-like peptidyl-prolyl isomerase